MSSIFDFDSDYDSKASQDSNLEYKPNSILFVAEECDHQLMAQAFKLCDADPNVNNQWIKAMDLLKWHEFKNGLFVIKSFDGNSFNYLCERKARIVGPLVILSCYSNHSINSLLLNTNWFKANPIINKCMENSFVCIEIKDQTKKQSLIHLIEYMSGTHCRRLTSNATHLIIDSFRPKLHRIGLNFGLSVVTEEWVFKCWEDSQLKTFNANNESIVKQFLVPYFKCVLIKNQMILMEDKRRIDSQNMVTKMETKDDGLDWIDFECKPTEAMADPNQLIVKPEDEKEFGQQLTDGLEWIYFDDSTSLGQHMVDDCSENLNMSPKDDMNKNITDLDARQVDDGLVLIDAIDYGTDYGSQTSQVDLQMADNYPYYITDLNEREGDDGLNWIQFDDNIAQLINNNQVVDTNSGKDYTLTADVSNKRKAETNENTFKPKISKQKSSFDSNNEMYVIWDNRLNNEFEGMPSQRPYFRI